MKIPSYLNKKINNFPQNYTHIISIFYMYYFCLYKGMDPNWRHIIPPGQSQVISEGQCVEECTSYAFPTDGIHIFAVMMNTHLIGKEVKLRQVYKINIKQYKFIFISSWTIEKSDLILP